MIAGISYHQVTTMINAPICILALLPIRVAWLDSMSPPMPP
ncbi:Uncharacterised protein [Edwardsiella hoshinae]|uniref:Uncharacterized protein n=1 Tax=Edwardsiella hoshinae TaxID=93378 RepID=A0A376DJ75_9GAMM|nr:Uncharacterised protein [Edwardsiella hoshinae]